MAKASDFEGKKQDELFYFVDYSPEEAERVGYSNYSYWGSVIQNFLKHKAAVVCLILFLFLVIFSFIALAIGKYDYQTLVTDSSLAFRKPNSEYWFGTDNLGRDYWCQVWYATQVSIRLALIVAVGESILGVIIGLIWGYVRKLDRFFNGAPSFGRQGLNSIGSMLLNVAARSYGDAAVAGMSIVSRIFQFVLSVAIGVGQGLQPVAAFNYGARRFARVRKAAIFTISTAFVFMAVLNSLCWFNAEPLIRLFRDDPEVTAVALPALRYQCVAMFLQPVIIVTNMMFQSIGKSGRATFLACCRQGVCFIPLILTLPRIWGLSGIELCQPIADGLTFCISVPFLLPFLKELKEQGDEE